MNELLELSIRTVAKECELTEASMSIAASELYELGFPVIAKQLDNIAFLLKKVEVLDDQQR